MTENPPLIRGHKYSGDALEEKSRRDRFPQKLLRLYGLTPHNEPTQGLLLVAQPIWITRNYHYFSVKLGFKREELRFRYDVSQFQEDDWHSYAGEQTYTFVASHLKVVKASSSWLLNAGAGVYALRIPGWREVTLDLFDTPIRDRKFPICGNIEQLPFADQSLGSVVCVGEVLGYVDPTKAISEFGRVLVSGGGLICDFRSSRSFRNMFTRSYGREADLVTDQYNNTAEPAWIYDPGYISTLLISAGFKILETTGIHTWSGLARKAGLSISSSVFWERRLNSVHLPSAWSDITTFVAHRI